MPIPKNSWLCLLDFYEASLKKELETTKRPEYIKYYSFRIESCNREIKDILNRELDG